MQRHRLRADSSAPAAKRRAGAEVSWSGLITRSTFTADATAGASSTSLGRAWDDSQVDVATYAANVQTGVFPNGQAVVRESTLGSHVQLGTPWRAAATTGRVYSSVAGALPANRFYEFGNTGPGAAPAPAE